MQTPREDRVRDRTQLRAGRRGAARPWDHRGSHEIQTTDSLNLEIDRAQEELEETMDAVVDILNIL